MSETEKFEVQGRAYAALKTAQSNVATLTVTLHEFATQLTELGNEIRTFIADPGRRDTSGLKPQSENLGDHLNRLDMGSAAFRLKEIFEEATTVRVLEDQIKKF